MKRPTILYAVSLNGEITVHPIQEYHQINCIGGGLWLYMQNDGSTHELWETQLQALKSARRDLKRLTNFLVQINKRLSAEIKARGAG